MGREEGYWPFLLRANSDRLTAVAAIFRGEHQLLLVIVEIAFGPTKVVALRDLQEFLGGEVRALIFVVELRPVFVELVASLLGRIEAQASRIHGNAVSIANAGGIALGGREFLVGLIGVVTPDASPRLKLRAGLVPGDIGHAVLRLARIGRRRHR